jgi:hypothetical protein
MNGFIEYWHLILRDMDEGANDIILCVDNDQFEKAKTIIKEISEKYHSGDVLTEDAVWIAGGLLQYIYNQLNNEWINFYVFHQDENNTIYY